MGETVKVEQRRERWVVFVPREGEKDEGGMLSYVPSTPS